MACAGLVLGDPGRDRSDNPDKPVGSVHGDSVGVHASDSANAWRHIARVSNARNTFASLIAGAYHTAGQNGRQMKSSIPARQIVETIRDKDPAVLLKLTEEAIRAKDQRRVAPLAHCYGQAGHDARGLFALLLRFAVSEDGALHAEKYYRTVTEEFATVRPAFRWQHLVALCRVTASEYGRPRLASKRRGSCWGNGLPLESGAVLRARCLPLLASSGRQAFAANSGHFREIRAACQRGRRAAEPMTGRSGWARSAMVSGAKPASWTSSPPRGCPCAGGSPSAAAMPGPPWPMAGSSSPTASWPPVPKTRPTPLPARPNAGQGTHPVPG